MAHRDAVRAGAVHPSILNKSCDDLWWSAIRPISSGSDRTVRRRKAKRLPVLAQGLASSLIQASWLVRDGRKRRNYDILAATRPHYIASDTSHNLNNKVVS
jgi:hypothetical protein